MKILRVRAFLLKLIKNLILKQKVDVKWMFKMLCILNKNNGCIHHIHRASTFYFEIKSLINFSKNALTLKIFIIF